MAEGLQQIDRRSRARRTVLAIAGVVFLSLAAASLAAPARMARPLGYTLDNTTALNEFRAIYVGLWAAHAAVFLWAAWRIDLVHLGDVAGLLLLGQVVGRLLSLALDGIPAPTLFAPAAAETLGAILILALRRPAATPQTRGQRSGRDGS